MPNVSKCTHTTVLQLNTAMYETNFCLKLIMLMTLMCYNG